MTFLLQFIFNNNLETIIAVQFFNNARRRSKHIKPFAKSEFFNHGTKSQSNFLCGFFSPKIIRGTQNQSDNLAKRRVIKIFTGFYFFFVKFRIVLRFCTFKCIKLRIIRLEKHTTLKFSTSCTSCHLRKQLKTSFRCSEIRQIETCICRNYPNQCNIRIIQTFCNHLSTD